MSSSRSHKQKSDQAAPRRFGKLPPRYRFILNPYPDQRFSSCPELREADQVAQVCAAGAH